MATPEEAKMFKRIALFLAVNCLVILTISLILSLLNVRPYLTSHGLDLQSLMIFCLIWGMVGALISLALSRKTITTISADPRSSDLWAVSLLSIHPLPNCYLLSATPATAQFSDSLMVLLN